MPDLTRDEWDDMQEGWDANGSPSITWQCDYCKEWTDFPVFEEGDLIECERCNLRLDAIDYYRSSDIWRVDVVVTPWGDITTDICQSAILKYLSKG